MREESATRGRLVVRVGSDTFRLRAGDAGPGERPAILSDRCCTVIRLAPILHRSAGCPAALTLLIQLDDAYGVGPYAAAATDGKKLPPP